MSDSLEVLKQVIPGFAISLSRFSIATYDAFTSVLMSDIDNIVEDMQRHKNQHPEDKSENQLTEHILACLRMLGYQAERDTDFGGHCDLCVQKSEFMWLGEAKKHGDYQYLADGFHQLCTRYSNSSPTASLGGLLIYIHQSKGAGVVKEWKERLNKQELKGLETYDGLLIEDASKHSSCFYSRHLHHGSGLNYRVRHIPIFLHHKPMDKSARNSK
jgi:hypothetical protein